MTISYDGTDFGGWQVQPNARTVQEELERAVEAICGHAVRIIGAGRTDAGVHATGQVAHADIDSRLDDRTLRRALNAHLPADISVLDLATADPEFHARYSASSRSYIYTIVERRLPLERHRSWHAHGRIEHEAIAEAAVRLRGTHDFSGIAKRSDVSHGWCIVFDADWRRTGEGAELRIRANRFLYGLVRALTGALIDVGRGLRSLDGFDGLLRGEAEHAGRRPALAPPQGLVLSAVGYDDGERALVNAEYAALRRDGRIPERMVQDEDDD